MTGTINEVIETIKPLIVFAILAALLCYFLGPSLNEWIDINIAFILILIMPILLVIAVIGPMLIIPKFLSRINDITPYIFGIISIIAFFLVYTKISFWLYLLLSLNQQNWVVISIAVISSMLLLCRHTFLSSNQTIYSKSLVILTFISIILVLLIIPYNLSKISTDMWDSAKTSAIFLVWISIYLVILATITTNSGVTILNFLGFEIVCSFIFALIGGIIGAGMYLIT